MITIHRRVRQGLSVFFVALVIAAALDLCFPPDLRRYQGVSQELYGAEGELLHVVQTADDKWRLSVDLQDVDTLYIKMLVQREDRYFWQHWGVNPLSFVRAVYRWVVDGRLVSGGSTLTMQVARLLEPRPRTLGSKVIQIIRAVQLERRYSKEEILRMYLSLAPFGSNLEGAQAASRAYFGKPVKQLLPSEAALLVALPQSPKLWQKGGFSKATLDMRNRVLKSAYLHKLIDCSTYEVACLDPLPDSRFAMPRDVPHLARRLLAGQQKVTCTIQAKLQQQLEQVADQSMRLLPDGVNMAMLVVHHPSRRVVAYVASSGFFDAERSGQVDFITAYRSPGSTLKPFIYGIAFDQGLLNPASFLLDDRMRFGAYRPDNFDRTFYGMVTASEALIYSLNIPAVDLLNRIGPMRFLGSLEEAGITLRFPDSQTAPGLSVALGGVGMTLEQLVTLYTSLSHGGLLAPIHYLPDEEDAVPARLVTARSANQLTEILAQTLTNEMGEPCSDIAVKTGTSYGYRDAWAVGYNGEYTVGVWIGRPDGAAFGVGTGRTLAVPVLQKAFKYLPSDRKLQQPKVDKYQLVLQEHTNQAENKLLKQYPHMLFPMDGTVVETAGYPITLSASGGKRPYTWLVDGAPVASQTWNPKTPWKPDKPGFYHVCLLDAEGAVEVANIEVQ